MNNKSANAVINRIQNIMQFNSDSDMWLKLEINRATLGNWRLRDSVPYSLCVIISESEGVSLDWLLTGEGKILKNDATKTNTKIELEISDLTSLFNEQEQQEILIVLKEKRRISVLETTVQKLQALLPS
jgi:hypothetical protein